MTDVVRSATTIAKAQAGLLYNLHPALRHATIDLTRMILFGLDVNDLGSESRDQ
jgi:hypothetical protein